ncbi:hypothetical protein [Burkholderia sp. BCC0405]|uniref:hypothetical protein n=1 Tax=Burkholderia sp. BCC0405 TaxID=2676298 RepID=UPI00158BB0CB|nr:hypothetical protein [Burkholderia sp. BCC0405]
MFDALPAPVLHANHAGEYFRKTRSTHAGEAEIRHATSTANACTIDTDCQINIVLISVIRSLPGGQVMDFHRHATACRAARKINGSLLHRLASARRRPGSARQATD